MIHKQESTRAQLLQMANLADLVGELLDNYIDAQEVVIAEIPGDSARDREQLLQEVDAYRERFAELVGIDPNTAERDPLADRVESWRELVEA